MSSLQVQEQILRRQELAQAGIQRVLAMSTQYLSDMAIYLGDCGGVDVDLIQINGEPGFALKENAFTDQENFKAFWMSLTESTAPDGVKVSFSDENKTMAFNMLDGIPKFLMVYAEKYRQGIINGAVTLQKKPLEDMEEPTLKHLHGEIYCGEESLKKAWANMRLQLGTNPFLHFSYTSYDLNRAMRVVKIDGNGIKNYSNREVLRFQ